MSHNIKINYVNKSLNRDMPKIFLFSKNEIPTPVAASRDGHPRQTEELQSSNGSRSSILEDGTDIVQKANGNAGDTHSDGVADDVQTEGD